MARTKALPELLLSGKLGNLVFVQQGDEVIVRTAPRKRKPDSWSEKQLAHRARFQAVNRYYQSWREQVVKPIWNQAATAKQTGYNLFIKANMPAFDASGTIGDYSLLHFSTGALALPQALTASRTEDSPDIVRLSWKTDCLTRMEHANDELLLVLLQEEERRGPITTGAQRQDGSYELQLPPTPPDKPWHAYLFFRNAAHRIYSPDKYFLLHG